MGAKVSFNPLTKIITITQAPSGGVVDLDTKIDIYSDGKEDWINDSNLTKYRFPIRAIGGDQLPGSRKLGSTFFLQYGWRIKPYEANHTLRVEGNLYTDEGDSPFLATNGAYTVSIINTVSSLIEAVISTQNVVTGDLSSVPTAQEVATAVWSDAVTNYSAVSGSFGQFIQNKLLTVKKFLGLK